MNFIYKIKAIGKGFFSMNNKDVLNSIYCFIHFRKCYAYESGWFIDALGMCSHDREDLWRAFGAMPQVLIFGLFRVIVFKGR